MDQEVSSAATSIYHIFDQMSGVSRILALDHLMGSKPELELVCRSFLASVFHHEIRGCNPEEVRHLRRIWLASLFRLVGRDCCLRARLLLLMSSTAKGDVGPGGQVGGVQWVDHLEHNSPQSKIEFSSSEIESLIWSLI